MRLRNIFSLALCVLTTFGAVSCQDGDWDDEVNTSRTIWNDTITERNVKTIDYIKTKFKTAISNSSYALVEEDIQLKAWITVNDLGGNISQQLVVQDETGYIIIGITEDSMHSYAKPGQVILLNLKGLYIGGYGMNGQIGYPGMSSTSQAKRIGRMDRYTWYNHVKFLPETHPLDDAAKFDKSMDMDKESNKLVYVEGSFSEADGKSTLADPKLADAGNSVNRTLNIDGGGTVTIRTSCYSDFGSLVMPVGKVKVVGIAVRYNTSSWQIQMRTADDLVAL